MKLLEALARAPHAMRTTSIGGRLANVVACAPDVFFLDIAPRLGTMRGEIRAISDLADVGRLALGFDDWWAESRPTEHPDATARCPRRVPPPPPPPGPAKPPRPPRNRRVS